MAVLSRYPIDFHKVRTFQKFLWKDMPGAMLPDNPATPAPADWYSPAELDVFRLSSKSHWDLPIRIDKHKTVHFLVSHPTPPTFDGPDDRNGTRNHDEIRFWADYVSGEDYMYDDRGRDGGLKRGESFVIAGDQNSDPVDGDSVEGSIQQLIDNPRIGDPLPTSAGGTEAAVRQGGANAAHHGRPEVRHRGLQRQPRARQPAGGLRAAVQAAEGEGLRRLLAGALRPAVPPDRRVPVPVLRPPGGVGRPQVLIRPGADQDGRRQALTRSYI